MTAFDNIKTNNWPATSNDFEDFLVLKMPLNDQASLTESLPVVAGSQELFPKRTLTNTGVNPQAYDPNAGTQINIAASEYSTSGSVTHPGNLFDGNTATTISSSDGSRIYWTPASNISVSKFEVYFTHQYGDYKIGVEVTGGSSQIITKDTSATGNSPGWVEFSSIAGDTIGPSNQVMFRSYRSNDTDPGVLGIAAVRVNDKIVTTAAAGIPKKHYDNNAKFNGSSAFLYHAADKLFNLGTDDWCIECWFNKDNLNATGQIFQLGIEVNYTNNIELSVNSNGAIRFHMYGEGTSQEGITSSNNAVTAGTWHHMACTRQGTTFRGFLDGVQQGSWTKAATWNVGSSTASHNSPTIGARTNGSRSAMHVYFGGVIQDFRLYRGIAKYTSNFTPPGAILG